MERPITLCKKCGCMTHTIKNKCGKCKALKLRKNEEKVKGDC
jgi:uncharacterized OB-fold protein